MAVMAIQIKLVETIDQMSELADFMQMIWDEGPDVVSFDLGYALLHVGGYGSLAYDSENNGKLVGASFGARGVYNNQDILHSHVTASTIPGVGYQLKQHQLQWAKEQNISTITWTFDPMVRRNCVFNLVKLGATAVEFLPNFYGTMTDIINFGDQSDRLFAIWPTQNTQVIPVAPRTNNIALANIDDKPKRIDFDQSAPYAIYLPTDIEQLRKTDLELVKDWRKDVHELLDQAFRSGAMIDRMADDRKALLVTPKN